MGQEVETQRLHDGELDLEAGLVRRGGELVGLTPIEQRLLRHLVQRSGEVVDRDTLLVEVWGYAPGVVSRAVDKTLHRLRAKLEADPGSPRHLCAEPGRGVVWRAAPPLRVDGRVSLLGRDAELSRLARELDAGGGVIQLVGRGGVGKTTLARSALERWQLLGRDGLWIDLASARSADELVVGVGQALGLPPDAALETCLGDAIAGRDAVLLVLDNLEQLPSAVAELVAGWTRAAPEARLLCTSRSPLEGLGGVEPLGSLAPGDAAALFCERAAEVIPGGNWREERAAIGRIVAAVDHLPLAIELAAARVDVCGLVQLGERLSASTELLRRAGAGPDRHATMDAVLSWTWDLLSPPARAVLGAASLFAAPVQLEGLEAVAGALGVSGDGVVADAASDLRRRGLISVERTPRGPRLAVHLTVRHFARARLAGDALPAAEQAHARYVLEQGRAALDALHGPDGPEALGVLEELAADLWSAAERVEAPEPWSHCLQPVFKLRGPLRGWLALADRAVTGARDPAAQARALGDRGYARLVAGEGEGARQDLDQVLALPVEEDPEAWCMAAIRRAFLSDLDGQPARAGELLDQALAVARRQRMPRVVALALADQGIHLWRTQDFDAAEAAYADADARLEILGDRVQRVVLALNRAHNLRVLGRNGAAAACARDAMVGARTLGFLRVEAVARLVLADLADGYEAAEPHLDAALALGRRLASDELVGVAFTRRAAWLIQTGDGAAARTALTQAAIRLEGLSTQATDAGWFGQSLRRLLGVGCAAYPEPSVALASRLTDWEAAMAQPDAEPALKAIGRAADRLQHPEAPDLRRLVKVSLGHVGTR